MTITEPQAASSTAILDGLKIIDSDSHFTEPPDLWLSRRRSAPSTARPTGSWTGSRGRASAGTRSSADARKSSVSGSCSPSTPSTPAPGASRNASNSSTTSGSTRRCSTPNGIGFSSNHIFAIEDLEQRSVVLQTLNDFYIDVQHESDDRLLPQAMLPIWDMDFTVREMTRLVDKGIRGFTLSDRPELLGLPELNAPYFDPMWDMFNSTRSVTNFHIGSGNRRDEVEARRAMMLQAAPSTEMPKVANPSWSSFGPMRQLAVTAILGYMSNARIIVNMIVSDLFDRFENLKIVSAESGIGWIPFLIESCEWQLDEMVVSPSEVGLTKRRPREYFQDHFYVMFWFERHGPQHAIEAIGVNNVLVETDIPHPTCKYPGAREHFADVLSGLDSHTVRRVLQDNAAEIYKLAV
jgi:uncharacterized protein